MSAGRIFGMRAIDGHEGMCPRRREEVAGGAEAVEVERGVHLDMCSRTIELSWIYFKMLDMHSRAIDQVAIPQDIDVKTRHIRKAVQSHLVYGIS